MMTEHPISGKKFLFVDKNLPFGASVSCKLFQEFSDSLRHIVEELSGRRMRVTNYLDDFLFVEETEALCNRLVGMFIHICQEIRLPLADDKTEWATKIVVFWGIVIDGEHAVLSIPMEKRIKALNLLQRMGDKKKGTVNELQVLSGTLNFLNKAIYPGRAFTRRMYAKFDDIIEKKNKNAGEMVRKKLKPHHHVSLDQEFHFDCKMWELFLNDSQTTHFCRPIIDLSENLFSTDIKFETDASLCKTKGFGCFYDGRWTFAKWLADFIEKSNPSIAYVELYALVAGILTWSHLLTNTRITVFCDNESVVKMTNHITSGSKNCMHLIRLLTLDNLKRNRRVFAKHIDTKSNSLADSLSRLQFRRFWRLAPQNTEKLPSPLPGEIWPVDKIYDRW